MTKPVAALNTELNRFRPTGELRFARLVDPNDGHRFHNGKLTCRVNLAKGDPENEAFVKLVNGHHREIGGQLPVVKDGDLPNTKNIKPAPGYWMLDLKAGPNSTVKFVDAARNKISPSELEDGDTVRVRLHAYDYSATLGRPGISLWMDSFQLIAKSAGDFDEYEGGYVAPVGSTAAAAPSASGPTEAELEADRYTGGFTESMQHQSTEDIIASVKARNQAKLQAANA